MTADRLDGTLAAHPAARLVDLDGEPAARSGDQVTRAADPPTRHLLEALLAGGERLDLGAVPADVVEQVRALYERLRAGRVVAPRDQAAALAAADPVVRGLWARADGTVDVATIAERLATRSVAVHGDGPLAQRVRELLASAGARVDSHGQGFAVVVATGDDDPVLQDFNRVAYAGEVPWLAVTGFDGVRATVGPLVLPGASACAECVRLRRAATFPARELCGPLAGPVLARSAPRVRHPALEAVVAGAVADVALAHLALGSSSPSSEPGTITTWTLGPRGPQPEVHRVLRVPRCGVCSVAAGAPRPQVWAHPDPPAEVRSC
jgi:bacteriocin biosynthesis cyclodehydratase domain-containing protein